MSTVQFGYGTPPEPVGRPVRIQDGVNPSQLASVDSSGAVSVKAASNTGVDIGATTDAGASWTTVYGVSGAAVVSADITTATAVTDAPTSSQKIVITDIVVSTDTAMSILFEEETSGTDIFKLFLPANGSAQITTRGKIKLATADKKLTAKASVAGNVACTVTYYSE